MMRNVVKELVRKVILFMLFVMVVLPGQSVYAEDVERPDMIEISTPQDLINIKDNPDGYYILTDNIDMKDIQWVPIEFSGCIEGNGYTIMNLTVSSVGNETADTYYGNYIVYDTYFAGMFSKIDNATIVDLNLLNITVDINTENNCFIGTIAGYSNNSFITGCSVNGRLSLTVDAPMFGVGGVVGYGNGEITEVTTDTTLVCIDTNVEERDEQFLGGVCGAGYVNVNNCNITLDGYVSDHGYVHTGGLIGMYIFYPRDLEYYGSITYNHVEGKITFFEDNTNRRAYCQPMIGEIMIYEFEYGGNTDNFLRDERFEYDKNLLPDMCEGEVYEKVITEATPESFGYTTYTCPGCGYTYVSDYTIYREPEEESIEEITKETEETSSVEEPTTENNDNKSSDGTVKKYIIIGLAIVFGIVVIEIIVKLCMRKSKKK